MNDQNFSLSDFQAWLSNYNQNKKNQQNFGVQNIPARIFRKTINLSTAGILQNTGIPFDGLQVEKIYNTASGLSVDGSINIIFDRAMSDSQFNYKVLEENDSFTSGTSISRAFFSWAAQAGVSADIVFFNDIDYKSGSQKTSLIGTVSIANTLATAMYGRENVPTLTTASVVTGTTSTTVYTCPVGKVAIVTVTSACAAAADYSRTKLNGAVYHYHQGATNTVMATKVKIKAGDVIACDSNQTNSASAGFMIEEYTI